MRTVGLWCLIALLGPLTNSPSDARARDGLRVLRSDERGLEVEWSLVRPELVPVAGRDRSFRLPRIPGALHEATAGEPDLPSIVQLVALPWEGSPRVRVLSVETASMPLPDLAPGPVRSLEADENGGARTVETRVRIEPAHLGETWPLRWAEVDGGVSVRGLRVGRLVLHPCRYDGRSGELVWAVRLRVRLEYGEAEPAPDRNGAPRSARDRSGFFTSALLNSEVAERWRVVPRRGGAPRGTSPSFTSAGTWIKFPITESGVYRLDYDTIANLGFDPAGIDPRTLRVFSGTNLELEEDLFLTPPPDFMTECALLDLGNGDGIFDRSDRFLFYALSTSGWASEYDPSLPRTRHFEHWYTDTTWYWVAWGNGFPGPVKRMSTRSVPAVPGSFSSTAPHRLHYEQNFVDQFRYPAEDGWMWEDLSGRGRDRLYLFNVDRPASGAGFLTARICSYSRTTDDRWRSVELKVGGQVTTTWNWQHTSAEAVLDVTGCFGGLLVNGENRVEVNMDTGLPDSNDHAYTAWFELEYDRFLSAENGRYLKFVSAAEPPELPVHTWSPPGQGGEVDTVSCQVPGSLVYGNSGWILEGFDAPEGEIFLLDVSDQHDVVRLVDYTVTNAAAPHGIRFRESLPAGDFWYVATTMDGVKPLSMGEVANLRNLRSPSNGANYVVIHHPDLQMGAERLASLQAAALPDSARTTMVVDVEAIYDEFGWGLKDPISIRNFLASTYDADTGWNGGAPAFVALVGDAAFDTKGFLEGSPENMVPAYSRSYQRSGSDYVPVANITFYSTDDFFGYIEAADYGPDPTTLPGLDLAIGRYPVTTEEDLEILLDKLEAYLAYEMPGQWQNRVLLVADDEVTPDADDQHEHTDYVETLSRGLYPPALDRVKVYLTEFARNDFGKKPDAQAAFIEEFTRGALMTTYTGHGDQNTMAQEEVFVVQKIPELLNEDRYTVFSTFSCSVSRFDLLSGNSMTELLLLHEDGGAVTTFSSTALVYGGASFNLNKEWLGSMFGTPYIIPTYARTPRSLGEAAMIAKVATVSSDDSYGTVINNEKYALLGDPALVVRFGRYLAEFDQETVNTQYTELVDPLADPPDSSRAVRVIRGTIRDDLGNIVDSSNPGGPFDGTAYVHVTENADTAGYTFVTDQGNEIHIDYTLDGSTTYRGEVPVRNGRFEAKFFISEGVLAGNRGRVSVFALSEDRSRDASGAYDSLRISPTIAADTSGVDLEGPVIRIGFEGYDNFIEGDYVFTDTPVLDISIADSSGVNLRPFPQFARLEAEIDGQERVNLGEDFTYREGSYTQGRVRRILSLASGPHHIEVKAYDNVGNRSTAGIDFTIVLPSDEFDIVDRYVTVFPNPMSRRGTHFLFRLTHDAEVTLKVFTITGRKIYEQTDSFSIVDGGSGTVQADKRIPWDGRDLHGRPLANGTYLYKLDATSTDEEGIRRSDEFVGHVVMMR
jgi:hypothetical protein